MSGARAHGEARPEKTGARAVSRPDDRHEREAKRAAEVVARGGSVGGWSFSAVPATVQRQETKEKTEDEKQKEALKKAGEAALETKEGQAIKEKVLNDPLVKPVVDAISTTPGTIATVGALAGGVVALGAAGKELPIQPPEIPGEKIHPSLAGISAKVTWEGPVFAPTNASLLITVKERGPKKKGKAPDPIAADIARLKAQEEMFRRGRTYAPGSKEPEEERLLNEGVQKYVLSRALPGFAIPLTPPAQEKKPEEQAPAQPAPASPTAETPALTHVDGALAGGGRPLDPQTRRTMEARFGHTFSGVRIHDHSRAAATAAGINAAAFTVGQDIAFGPGRYSPSTTQGRELLAHELAHTIQQRGAATKAPPVAPGSALEARAAEAGRTAAGGRPVTAPLGRSGRAVARQPAKSSDDVAIKTADALNQLLAIAATRRLSEDQADALITLVATFVERFPKWVFAVVVPSSDQLYFLLAPWGFVGGSAGGNPAAGIRSRGGELVESLERSIGVWKTETPDARRARRQRMPRFGGGYVYVPTERDVALRESQIHTEELPGGRVYTGPRSAVRAERRRAEVEVVKSKIEGVVAGGPFATAGRVVGAVTGAATGRDVLASSEIGATIGGIGDVAAAGRVGTKARARVREGTSRVPGQSQPAGARTARARPEEVTPAQVRALYRAEPDAVKKSLSNSFHQQVWEQHGGTGPAPLAFRTGRVLHVNEAQWSRVGNIAEINQPHELIGAPARLADPAATARTLPAADPATARTQPASRAPTAPGVDPAAGTARTLPDPRARTVPDPNAPPVPAGGTQPSAPPARPPVAPPRPARRGMQPATPVGLQEAVAASRADPRSVHRSVSSDWHEQVYRMDRGRGDVPVAFRSGNTIVVDPSRLPPDLRAQLGTSP